MVDGPGPARGRHRSRAAGDGPEEPGAEVRLEGAELQSAREVALHWVFEPAAEAVWDGLPPVEERSSEEMRRALAALDRIGWPPTPPLAVAEARLARALLERIGWPGEALRLILIDG